MIDFAVDDKLQFYQKEDETFASVDGIDEFEQSIRLMISEYMFAAIIGKSNKREIKNKIRLQVSRVAKDHNRLEDISEIGIMESKEDPNTYNVNINYKSNSSFEFAVSE